MLIKLPLPLKPLKNARELRRHMTDAEAKLWFHLRGGRLDKIKFRRQHPIPPYIIDFYCETAQLVIELDGSQHTVESDAERTRYLERQGLKILRFWDNEVLQKMEAVLGAILDAIQVPYPHPAFGHPLSKGEGFNLKR